MKISELTDSLPENAHETLATQVKIENVLAPSEITKRLSPTVSKDFWYTLTLREANMYLNFISQSFEADDHSVQYSTITPAKNESQCIGLAYNRNETTKKFSQKLSPRQIVDIITGSLTSGFLIEQLDWTR